MSDKIFFDKQTIRAILYSSLVLAAYGLGCFSIFFLHKGVPQYCTLEGKGIGAKRVCHFDKGVIEEQVTEWQPPTRLKVAITKITLPGRKWLGFVDATYDLKQINAKQTLVTRTTTVTSILKPGWYWRFFEHLGTKSEHEYLLSSIANTFSGP